MSMVSVAKIGLCTGLVLGSLAPSCSAFSSPVALRPTNSRSLSCSSQRSGALSLRAQYEEKDGETFVKLEQTQTSWTGWGGGGDNKEVPKIKVDSKDPGSAVKEALKKAREYDDIAKYLGTSDSKKQSGITGDVEFVGLKDSTLTLRLVGNFWHNRQMVFDDVGNYIKKALPMGTVTSIVIEDPAQLEGFAETSNAFKDRKQITDDDLNAVEAKEVKNMYGEALEGPAAEFKRRKAEADAKYQAEMEKRRQLEGSDESDQIQAILAEKGLGGMFGGSAPSALPDENDLVRPEDILKQMM